MSQSWEADIDVLLVGVDAACHDVLDPLFRADELPTLQSVFETGVDGSLRSQIPPWTASAWPSLYTGTNPGKHGVFGFLQFDGYEWDVVDATRVRARPLWQHLDLHGRSSVVVNVPMTHPPEPFDGALVPGYVAPENPRCHPAGLLTELEDAIGDYRLYAESDDGPADAETFRELVRMRGRAFRYLADRYDPEFGFVQFQQTDTVVHEAPGDRDRLAAVYRAVDEQLAAILEHCDPSTVVVASDHGIGPYDGPECRVNECLRAEGYVETTVEESGMPNWVRIREQRLRNRDTEGSPALETAVNYAASVGLTAQRVAAMLDRLGLTEAVGQFVPDAVQQTATEQVDFERSVAYMRDAVELGVRINLAGREPAGVVPPEDYEAVRSELIDALASLTTPDGTPVFEEVGPREAYFDGPHADEAVDVVTVPTGFDVALSTQLYGEPFGDLTEPWNHKRQGVIAARGQAVDTGSDLDDAHLFDVAPTVLAMLGVPPDERMDGRQLSIVERLDEQSYPPYETTQTAVTTDEATKQHLTALGYIETE